MRNIKSGLRIGWRILKITIFLLVFVFISYFGIQKFREFFNENSIEVPTDGGIYTEATIGSLQNLNPFAEKSTLVDKDIQYLIYAGLLKYNPISGQIEDGLASLRISEDFRKYHLSIRDSAQWSNGDRVSVDDVLFTYNEVIKNPLFRNQKLRNFFEYIRIEKETENTVVFELVEPNYYFLSALTLPILHAKSYQKALIEEILDPNLPENISPIGAGPYVLKNIVPGQDGVTRIFFAKNKYYYEKVPFVEQIVFYVYKNFEQLRESESKAVIFSRIPAVYSKNFAKKLADNYTKREYHLPRFVGIFFNLEKEIINKKIFREALKFSINKKNVLEEENNWTMIDSFFFFDGIEDFHQNDPAAGRKILADYKFVSNENKKLFYKNQEVKLKMITSVSPPVYSRFSQKIVNTWREELGLNVELAILEDKEFQQALKNRDYDIVLFGQDFENEINSLAIWSSHEINNTNLSNLNSPDVDFLINERQISGSESDLFQLNHTLSVEIPAVVIATPKYNIFINKFANLNDYSAISGKIRSHAGRFFGVENWYFETEKVFNISEDKWKLVEFVKWLLKTEE